MTIRSLAKANCAAQGQWYTDSTINQYKQNVTKPETYAIHLLHHGCAVHTITLLTCFEKLCAFVFESQRPQNFFNGQTSKIN